MRRIDANDLDEAAAAAVRQNLELNDSKASGLVRPTQGDVRMAALRVRNLVPDKPHPPCISPSSRGMRWRAHTAAPPAVQPCDRMPHMHAMGTLASPSVALEGHDMHVMWAHVA